MLRLKGSMLDRMPPEKRAKMEKTLQRMDSIRRIDDMRIRDIINAKKQWAEQEKKKGIDIIEQIEKKKEELSKEQEKIRFQLIKLDGCVMALNDVLTETTKVEELEKKAKEAESKRAAEEEAVRIAEAEKAAAEAKKAAEIKEELVKPKRVKKSTKQP